MRALPGVHGGYLFSWLESQVSRPNTLLLMGFSEYHSSLRLAGSIERWRRPGVAGPTGNHDKDDFSGRDCQVEIDSTILPNCSAASSRVSAACTSSSG